MVAVTPTLPLLTPYKMGKFNLSHRYLITHVISLFFNVQYGFVYTHFLEFAWFDVDDTLWSQFAFLFSAAKCCFCIQNSSVKSCWSLKIDFLVSFDMLGSEFFIRSSKTFCIRLFWFLKSDFWYKFFYVCLLLEKLVNWKYNYFSD